MNSRQINQLVATGEALYTGYLRDHIRLIVEMHSDGAGCQQIADHLNRTFSEFRDPHGYRVTHTQAGNIHYVLYRCGIERTQIRHPLVGTVRQYADLLPEDVLQKQASWDRRSRILRLVESGLTLREIGRLHSLSGFRISQIRDQARRERRRGTLSPIEAYLAIPPHDLHPMPKLVASAMRRDAAAARLAGPLKLRLDTTRKA